MSTPRPCAAACWASTLEAPPNVLGPYRRTLFWTAFAAPAEARAAAVATTSETESFHNRDDLKVSPLPGQRRHSVLGPAVPLPLPGPSLHGSMTSRQRRAWNSQLVSETVSVPARFNGPETSGHGGYCSGLFAHFVEGPAEVTLRSPVPLDTSLEIARQSDGSVRVLGGELLVAELRSAPEVDPEVPAPVSVADAERARERYRGLREGLFAHCFVCGRGRDDALGVFAGAVDGR